MRTSRWLSAMILAGFASVAAAPASAQAVAKRTAKKAAKKAVAPDAIDLNAATPEELAKLGLDEATVKKVVESRPFTSLDDPKVKEAIPADALAKLNGKVTVKPAGEAKPADAAAPADPASTAKPATPAKPPPQQ